MINILHDAKSPVKQSKSDSRRDGRGGRRLAPRFRSLTVAEQQFAAAEFAQCLAANGPTALRWPDECTFYRDFYPLILSALVRYDLPPFVAVPIIDDLCRRHMHDLHQAIDQTLIRAENRQRTPEEARLIISLNVQAEFWQNVMDVFCDQHSEQLALIQKAQPYQDIIVPINGRQTVIRGRSRGEVLRGIDRRTRLDADLDDLGADVRIVAPPSAEKLRRREAQEDAGRAASPVMRRIRDACDRLQRGDGLTRQLGCGCGDPLAFEKIEKPCEFFAAAHFCGELGCPRCEAFHRARLIWHGVEVILYQVPDGGILPEYKRDEPLKLPWHTSEVYEVICPESCWQRLKREINRAARAVGAAGTDRLSRPGYAYRRCRDGTRQVITEAPVRPRPGITVRRLSPAEAAGVWSGWLELSLFPANSRRRNDVRFAGRWLPRRKAPEWRRIDCGVSVQEFGDLAVRFGAVDTRPIKIDGLGTAMFAAFPSPTEEAVDVTKNGGDPIAVAFEVDAKIQAFKAAIATGVTLLGKREGITRQSDTVSILDLDEPSYDPGGTPWG